MEPKNNLTIQDYFKNVGVRSKRRPALVSTGSSTDRRLTPFDQVLESVQSKSSQGIGATSKGLTIENYRSLAGRRAVRPQATAIQFKPTAAYRSALNEQSTATLAETQSLPTRIARTPRGVKEASANEAMPTENLNQVQAKISRSIEKAAKKYKLSPDLLHAMVKTESDYQVRAVSPDGAQGLMQLMPDTAKELGVTNPYDIDQNIDGGAQYLRSMLDQFDGDLQLALAAYNAGPQTVVRYGREVPPYQETQTYIKRVLRHSNLQDS